MYLIPAIKSFRSRNELLSNVCIYVNFIYYYQQLQELVRIFKNKKLFFISMHYKT